MGDRPWRASMPTLRHLAVTALAVSIVAAGCSTAATTTTGPTATSAASTSTTSTTAAPTTTTTVSVDGVADLAALVTDLASHDEFSGVIVVAHEDTVLFEFAAGLADRETGAEIDLDTKMNLGSMNKMFTAVAVLQLAEQGAIDLDGFIADYLPDYPNPDVARQVTIEQLLTHTSGLGDAFTAEFEADPNAFRSNADYLPLFAAEPLLFVPGEQFSYSNAGYVVLGLIIERVSGEGYLDYVRRHVFEPSGMSRTDSYFVEDDVPDLAIGYTTQDVRGNETGVLAANTPLLPGRGFAAGGGYSTARDLLRFRDALFGDRLVSAASVSLLITGRVEMRPGVMYGYGFMDRVQAGRRVVGHTGGAPGVCSFLSMYPETGYTVVVLTNADLGCAAVLDHLAAEPPA